MNKLGLCVAASCLLASPALAAPVYTTPASVTLMPLDAAVVPTGGTAVTALAAAHRNKGGWLVNPSTATVALCINEIGTASGTASAGNLTCIAPGQTYLLTASPNAVSVVTSDSNHAFSGYGWN
jgi:hypothetical protein